MLASKPAMMLPRYTKYDHDGKRTRLQRSTSHRQNMFLTRRVLPVDAGLALAVHCRFLYKDQFPRPRRFSEVVFGMARVSWHFIAMMSGRGSTGTLFTRQRHGGEFCPSTATNKVIYLAHYAQSVTSAWRRRIPCTTITSKLDWMGTIQL